MLLDTAEAMTSDFDQEARVSLDKFADQLPSVFNQVMMTYMIHVMGGICFSFSFSYKRNKYFSSSSIFLL